MVLIVKKNGHHPIVACLKQATEGGLINENGKGKQLLLYKAATHK
jgi:hypothetical protein